MKQIKKNIQYNFTICLIIFLAENPTLIKMKFNLIQDIQDTFKKKKKRYCESKIKKWNRDQSNHNYDRKQ